MMMMIMVMMVMTIHPPSFMNGTVEGEEVFIPLDQIIGGRERAGFGWNMLMDCLAEGRGISLPAMSVSASKMTSSIVGAYARIRKQFKVREFFVSFFTFQLYALLLCHLFASIILVLLI